MNAGEFFVNLGVKGSEKTIGALTSVKKGLGELGTISLETKAAIVGATYALERLFEVSGKTGTELTNFNALTGLSTKQLQQYQYALMQAGGSAEDMTATIEGIQEAMARVDLNKGVPEGLALLSKYAGGIDFSKKNDPFYILAAYEKAMKNLGDSPKAKAIFNQLAGNLLPASVIEAMRLGKFSPSTFGKAPIYGDKEIASLNKANIAWVNLGKVFR